MIGSNTNVEMTLRSKGSGDIKLQSSANEDMAIFTPDGAVELYHNNIQAARTETNGFSVLGGEGSDANLYLFADEADDLADQWNITALAASSTFKIRNRNTNASYDTNLVCKGDGAVELYHDNSKKFYTTSTGAYIENRLDIGGANLGWSYPKPLNVQGSSGAILALRNWDTTTYAADTTTSIDFNLRTGNTGNQSGSCEIRAYLKRKWNEW